MNRRIGYALMVMTLGTVGMMAAGCSSGSGEPEGMPELFPITLSVTQGGAPLEGASVQMVPVDASMSRWACGGATDAAGLAHIKTLGQYDGAPSGKYKVTVYKTIVEGAAPVSDSPSAVSTQKSFAAVDPKFQSVATTTLTVEVNQGENSTQVLDVGAAVKLAETAI